MALLYHSADSSRKLRNDFSLCMRAIANIAVMKMWWLPELHAGCSDVHLSWYQGTSRAFWETFLKSNDCPEVGAGLAQERDVGFSHLEWDLCPGQKCYVSHFFQE